MVRCLGQLEQAETCLWPESIAQVSFIPVLGFILYSFLFVSWMPRSSISLLLKFAENTLLPAHPHKVVCLLILTLYPKCCLLRENPGTDFTCPLPLPASTNTSFPLNKPWVFSEPSLLVLFHMSFMHVVFPPSYNVSSIKQKLRLHRCYLGLCQA